MTVLQDQTKPSHDELLALIASLKQENSKLKDKGSSLKVTEKGGVSLYGLGRFPVTLYQSQWLKLLDEAETIRKFIADNQHRLASKPAKE